MLKSASVLLALITLSYTLPSSSFVQTAKPQAAKIFSTNLKYADLTPAVDKFPRLPSILFQPDNYLITAKGPMPEGPEPFGLVADDLQPLADYVRELVVSENPVLTMAASHFFEKVKYYQFVLYTLTPHTILLL